MDTQSPSRRATDKAWLASLAFAAGEIDRSHGFADEMLEALAVDMPIDGVEVLLDDDGLRGASGGW
jgi:hypothetical protein